MINEVEIAAAVRKEIRKVPRHVATKLLAWVQAVRDTSLEEVRKSPGFHDEPVKGNPGQRSIRLSRAYRAYYRLHARTQKPKVEFVRVERVDKHEYGK